MKTYRMTIELQSDTNPADWLFTDRLIIDEEYRVIHIKELGNERDSN
jgi:hypothetical protein